MTLIVRNLKLKFRGYYFEYLPWNNANNTMNHVFTQITIVSILIDGCCVKIAGWIWNESGSISYGLGKITRTCVQILVVIPWLVLATFFRTILHIFDLHRQVDLAGICHLVDSQEDGCLTIMRSRLCKHEK